MSENQVLGNAKYLSSLLGVDSTTIQRWVKEGMPRHAYGKYNLPVCIKWYVRNKAKDISAGAETKTESQSRLIKAKADKAEFDLAVAKGKFLPIAEIENQFCEGFGAVRQGLDNLPKKLAPQVVNCTQAEAEKIIWQEKESILDSIRSWSKEDRG